jgi:DNA-binding MarR family transcriptional regulator
VAVAVRAAVRAGVRGEPRLAPGPDDMSSYDITSRGSAEAAVAAPGAPGRRATVAATDEDVGDLTDEDYENLLTFRAGLRRFLHWSESQARAAGLTPAQHQLLLAIRGHRGEHGPTVGDLADYLMLRHHSAVELVDRAAAAGLVERWGDEADGRVIRVRLTPDGEARLARLAPVHLDELRSLAPFWTGSWPHGPTRRAPDEDRAARATCGVARPVSSSAGRGRTDDAKRDFGKGPWSKHVVITACFDHDLR